MSKIFKSHLKSVTRKHSYRKNINENYRLDMSERVINYSERFFDNFIQSIKQEDFICYPSKLDFDILTKKIAIFNNVDENKVFVSTGSDMVLKSIFDICCDANNNIVTTEPCFPMYDVYASICNSKIKKVKYSKNLTISNFDILNIVDTNTKIVVLANPNSPIGDWKQQKEILEIANYLKNKDILFIIDEAYVDFAPYSLSYLVNEYDNVIVVKTFSKAFGAAGCRIGYCLANENIIQILNKIRLSFPISSLSTKFGIYLLDNVDHIADYVNKVNYEKQYIKNYLTNLHFDVIDSYCNWLHFNNENNNLKESQILNKLGISFKDNVNIPFSDKNNWIRLTIGPNTRQIIQTLTNELEANI